MLLIDPQNDFHAEGGRPGDVDYFIDDRIDDRIDDNITDSITDSYRPNRDRSYHQEGSLVIPGANADSARIARMIENNMYQISEIYVTLDTHHVSVSCSCCSSIMLVWYLYHHSTSYHFNSFLHQFLMNL